jgi:hypothetical protein
MRWSYETKHASDKFLFQMTNFVFNDTFDTVDSIRPDSTLVRKNYDKK